ncbi:MAG: phosphatidylglycerophosphatase A [Vicinamibacterales bacterium]
MRRLATAIATAGYVGWFPVAPGTVGSIVGLAWWAAVRFAGSGPVGELIGVAALLVVGAWSATETERALGTTDPGPVVIDEVMGMALTLVAAPLSWPVAILGFGLFRVFDIVKPPPARALERLHGGWGIMADDVAAGVYAWAALQAAIWLLPEWLG